MIKKPKNKIEEKDPLKIVRDIRENKLKEFDGDLTAYVKSLKKKYETNKSEKKTKAA